MAPFSAKIPRGRGHSLNFKNCLVTVYVARLSMCVALRSYFHLGVTFLALIVFVLVYVGAKPATAAVDNCSDWQSIIVR